MIKEKKAIYSKKDRVTRCGSVFRNELMNLCMKMNNESSVSGGNGRWAIREIVEKRSNKKSRIGGQEWESLIFDHHMRIAFYLRNHFLCIVNSFVFFFFIFFPDLRIDGRLWSSITIYFCTNSDSLIALVWLAWRSRLRVVVQNNIRVKWPTTTWLRCKQ